MRAILSKFFFINACLCKCSKEKLQKKNSKDRKVTFIETYVKLIMKLMNQSVLETNNAVNESVRRSQQEFDKGTRFNLSRKCTRSWTPMLSCRQHALENTQFYYFA